MLAAVAPCFQGCSNNDDPQQIEGLFLGPYDEIVLGEEGKSLPQGRILIAIKAEDGTVFEREAHHNRDALSYVRLSEGLRAGTYRLLYATVDSPSHASDETGREEYGLGSRIHVTDSGIAVIDTYNPRLGCVGLGSKDDPFVITSSSHIFQLMMAVNDYDYNRLMPEGTYFSQECDIDMKSMSRSCDAEYGWMPIGANTNTPFRGVYLGNGYKIKNLIIKRPHTAGVGLFGFLHNAVIDGLKMEKCSVEGQFAVGTLAGAVITAGDNDRGTGTITNCIITDCTVSGNESSAMLGGLLGAVDMHSKALLGDCSAQNGSVSGGMNVGGIFGGAGIYSSVLVTGCDNSSSVKGIVAGAGGIVGTADTLQVVGSRNYARIEGPTSSNSQSSGTGTGGIVGGSGFSWITGCSNEGDVSGFEGVGGIIGSTRIKGSQTDSYYYNQSVLRYCYNKGGVSGTRFVGGAIGESQAGAFGVSNSGSVNASDYAGGICGTASVAVIHNSANSGTVNASSHAAGICGKATWGSFAINQNAGAVVTSSGWAGGIAGLAGNNTVITYCSNFAPIDGGSGYAGGIVGDIGEPREWTGWDIAECVVGSLECVMGLAGPCLAVAEGAVEMAHAVEIAIKIVETGIEVALQGCDYTLLGFGIHEMLNPEIEAELQADMRADAEAATADSEAMLAEIRNKCNPNSPQFALSNFGNLYRGQLENHVTWYKGEGNDEIFNENINEKREARAEQLEKIAHIKEIVHTTIAGVCVAVGTVTLIAGEIATGGAATAILAAGAVASIVGGVNAVVKCCTEFEKNAVIISQCVNAETVRSGGRHSSIAGRICDGCMIYDCLTTIGTNGEFAGDIGNHCEVSHNISLAPHDRSKPDGALNRCVYADSSLGNGVTKWNDDILSVSYDMMAKESTFTALGFSFGNNGRWILSSQEKCPYPNVSEMRK